MSIETGALVAVIMGLIELIKYMLIRYSKNGNGKTCHFGEDEGNQLRDLWNTSNKSNMNDVMNRLSITLTEIAMTQKATASIQSNIMVSQQLILDKLRDLR